MPVKRSADPVVARIQASVADALLTCDRVVLAVSGGVDSTVLLDAAAMVAEPARLIVATFDHGTGLAAAEASSAVESAARARGVECVVGRAPRPSVRGSEAAWRASRWRFLRRVAGDFAAVVATGHSADDQIETILMRIMRGAGARGIAGLRATSDVVRPLLAFRRSEIEDYAKERRLQWLTDPSNTSAAYLRNRLRHDLLPALRGAHPSIDDDLLELGRRASEWRSETDQVAHAVSTVLGPCAVDVRVNDVRTLKANELSVLWPAVAARVGLVLDRRGIARLASFSRSARIGAKVPLSGDWRVVRSRDALQLRKSEPVSAGEIALAAGAETQWGVWTFWPQASETVASVLGGGGSGWEAELPTGQGLRVRRWMPGDRLATPGGLGRKVKRLLSEAGVTGHERSGWPVVLCGDRIVWVPGVGRSAAATDRSGRPSLHFSCARYRA